MTAGTMTLSARRKLMRCMVVAPSKSWSTVLCSRSSRAATARSLEPWLTAWPMPRVARSKRSSANDRRASPAVLPASPAPP